MPPFLEYPFRPFQEFQFLRIHGMECASADTQTNIAVLFPHERHIRLFAYGKISFFCTPAVNKGVSVIIPVFGYIYQPVSNLRCNFGACPLNEYMFLEMTVIFYARKLPAITKKCYLCIKKKELFESMRNIVILNSLEFSYPLPVLMRVFYKALIIK